MKVATEFMFTKNSAKVAINKFTEKAAAAMVKKYR